VAEDQRQSSSTAVGVAGLRAAHQLIDGAPKVLDDTVIVRLLGPAGVEHVRAHIDRIQSPRGRGLRSHVLLRSRFAEDRLERAVARGAAQYVLLGAGLDTFAYRQPQWAHGLRIIEVDHPASQASKRERLAAANITAPNNLQFVAIDFEHESLVDGLRRCRVASSVPTFFSWLGVMVYLTEDAIDAVFNTVVGFPSSSEIVFTFAPPRDASDASGPAGPSLADAAAAAGEPWLSYHEPAALEQKLYRLGFTSVEFLTPAESVARYFADRTDGLPPPRRSSIGAARV
jgi:methyltransferase (TIGR00027 family)